MLKSLWQRFLKDYRATQHPPCCPRCGTPFEGSGEGGYYCTPCHTTFETAPEFRYDDPTRGVDYVLTGKSWYGTP